MGRAHDVVIGEARVRVAGGGVVGAGGRRRGRARNVGREPRERRHEAVERGLREKRRRAGAGAAGGEGGRDGLGFHGRRRWLVLLFVFFLFVCLFVFFGLGLFGLFVFFSFMLLLALALALALAPALPRHIPLVLAPQRLGQKQQNQHHVGAAENHHHPHGGAPPPRLRHGTADDRQKKRAQERAQVENAERRAALLGHVQVRHGGRAARLHRQRARAR